MNEYIEVLKKYGDFRNRAGRREFWMFCLFNFIVAVVLSSLSALIVVSIKNSL